MWGEIKVKNNFMSTAKITKCEWIPWNEKGKHLEANGKGGLVFVCTPHRRLLAKQKRINYT